MLLDLEGTSPLGHPDFDAPAPVCQERQKIGGLCGVSPILAPGGCRCGVAICSFRIRAPIPDIQDFV